MTPEEAILILKRDNPNNIAIRLGFEDLYDKRNEAFSMAIKSLEQESCTDCISRQYLLDNCVVDKVTMPYVPVCKIENAPPVTPQPKTDILDKIKQDIFNACCDIYHMPVYDLDYVEIFEIIDRYKTESEDKK